MTRVEAVVWDAHYRELERFAEADPLEALRRVLPPRVDAAGFPLPLSAGVGFVSYDAAARWEKLPVPDYDPVGLPEALFHMPSVVIAFDHLAQTATLATIADDGADERLASVAAQLAIPAPDEAPTRLGTPGQRPVRHVPPAADPVYEAGVAKLVEDIHAGEMLQVVPARRFTVPNRAPALTIYRALRRINPSPYLFALDLGPGSSILGASPELLVRVRDGEVVTRPLAGTRPRSDDPVRDAELEADLRADQKELAEHAMLVDLARNDVGRVAEAGSVEWPLLYGVERYSHVMHLVSEVRGRLRTDRDAFDAVRATFPAGTLSGAPKVRAMQAIAEVEGAKRGAYGGAVGYFSPEDTEIAITIRSVVLRDGTAFVHAGAGIVADSVPATESAEVAAKAGAVLTALAQAEATMAAAAGEGTRGMSAMVEIAGRSVPMTGVGRHIVLVDNYDSFTYNLYQYLLMLGAEVEVVRNDEITVDAIAAMDPDGIVISPGPSRPENAGISVELITAPRPDGPDAGRLPRPPGDGSGLRRRRHPGRAGPRQAVRGVPFRPGRLRGSPLPARRGSIPLAGHRPRDAARCPGGDRLGRRWAGHGGTASRLPGRGHPVPPGVDPHRRRRPDAVDVAGVRAHPG